MLYGCSSLINLSSSSVSVFVIVILRKNLQKEESGMKYAPTREDRAGFQIRCIDTTHPKWKNKADTEAISPILFPKFKQGT